MTRKSSPSKAWRARFGLTKGALFQLREWLTIGEAAKFLSLAFEEPVQQAAILRAALDGQLTLSVRFVNHATAKLYVERSESERRESFESFQRHLAACREAREAGLPIPKPEIRGRQEAVYVTTLENDRVFDLPMTGGERLDVENEYQRAIHGPELTLINLGQTLVDASDGTRFVLLDRLPDRKPVPSNDGDSGKARAKSKDRQRTPFYDSSNFYPIGGLPAGAQLIVRMTALQDFVDRSRAAASNLEHQMLSGDLSTKERSTLLTIIAALADEAKIDIQRHSKAAKTIESILQLKGWKVSARTIEEHLKRIPDAVERRRQR